MTRRVSERGGRAALPWRQGRRLAAAALSALLACGCWSSIAVEAGGSDELDPSEETAVALPWPIDPPPGGLELFHTDGQLQTTSWNNTLLHWGIDIRAEEGVAVHAIEAGTVMQVRERTDQYGFVAIASPGRTDEGFLYAHITEIAVELGNEVVAGQKLGRVARWVDPLSSEDFDHLHLQWVKAEPTVREDGRLEWKNGNWLSAGNTSRRLELACDDAPPEIGEADDGRTFLLRVPGSSELAEIGGAVSGKIEVVARIADRVRADSGLLLAPYSMSVGLRSQGLDEWVLAPQEIAFDGPGLEARFKLEELYVTAGPWESLGGLGERAFHYYLARAGAGGGAADAVSELDLSGLPAGQYELWVSASDAAGQRTERSMQITVGTE